MPFLGGNNLIGQIYFGRKKIGQFYEKGNFQCQAPSLDGACCPSAATFSLNIFIPLQEVAMGTWPILSFCVRATIIAVTFKDLDQREVVGLPDSSLFVKKGR